VSHPRRFTLPAMAAPALLLVLTGCGQKLSADQTARQVHSYTTSRRVTCAPGQGDLAAWDYQCTVYWRAGLGPPTTLGVNVNSTEVTDQTNP
jgi:hypothetical protein